MANFNRVWASDIAAAVTEPDPGVAEDGHDTVVPPRNDEDNWWQNRVDMALQSIERNGALLWDSQVNYLPGVMVLFGGSFYYAKTANINSQPNTNPSAWQASATAAVRDIPSGTAMLFYRAVAPIGWTKSTAINNSALRIVSGAGGSTGGTLNFNVVFTSVRTTGAGGAHTPSITVNNTTLSASQIPPHPHPMTTHGDQGDHLGTNNRISAHVNSIGTFSASTNNNTGGGGSHGHSAFAAAVGNHTHAAPSTNVKYADFIICVRD